MKMKMKKRREKITCRQDRGLKKPYVRTLHCIQSARSLENQINNKYVPGHALKSKLKFVGVPSDSLDAPIRFAIAIVEPGELYNEFKNEHS